jgi:hypothetical protein
LRGGHEQIIKIFMTLISVHRTRKARFLNEGNCFRSSLRWTTDQGKIETAIKAHLPWPNAITKRRRAWLYLPSFISYVLW